jgi:sugar O-acyltransferase (sialic acid O-acetyltransferase NeuD family)
MPERLIVFGSGGHAKVVVEAALAAAPGREIAILDDAQGTHRPAIFGIPVSGTRDRLNELPGSPVIVAVGDNRARGELINWLQGKGRRLESVVHPRAFVAESVGLGPGVFVSAGAVIIAEARIGAGAIINTGATVDHDCVIGEAAHIAPGVHLCGNVHIGARTLIGVGAAVRPGVAICDDVIVGAGSVVVRDIKSAGTFAGSPARPLR